MLSHLEAFYILCQFDLQYAHLKFLLAARLFSTVNKLVLILILNDVPSKILNKILFFPQIQCI